MRTHTNQRLPVLSALLGLAAPAAGARLAGAGDRPDHRRDPGDTGVLAIGEQSEADSPAAEAEPSRLHLSMGVDVTTAYYFRGIRQEDSGLIVQPYADLTIDAGRFEAATLMIKAGVWNSFHEQHTLSATGDSFVKNWYESDLYVGAAVASGRWTVDGRYIWYTSPSGAFGTVDEFDVSASFDDTDFLGEWSMKPSATVAVEVGSNAADGADNGVYLQLGVAPGFTTDAMSLEDVSVTFPCVVGLSLSDYYESAGEDEVFGFASLGARASAALPVDESWGAWSIGLGVQVILLGDTAQDFNEGDSAEIVGTFGVSVSY